MATWDRMAHELLQYGIYAVGTTVAPKIMRSVLAEHVEVNAQNRRCLGERLLARVGLREAFVDRIDLPDPADATAFAAALAEWELRDGDLLCLLVKTPGNGLTNDYSRPLAVRSIAAALSAARLRVPMIIASGGTEGIGIPHLIAFGRRTSTCLEAGPACLGLAIGHGVGAALTADEIGTARMAQATAEAVCAAMEDAGIRDPGEA